MAYLRGRLDVAIELLRAGRAREILVSGDAAGTSGDEIVSMTRYLAEHGVDPALVRSDGAGLSTWQMDDTSIGSVGVVCCRRIIVGKRHFRPLPFGHLPS
ncbi:ElyC/SanA/YdcF family protein [Nocardia sp. KC 131]|uniref:ElyC/SanA/YdcF family protein n=1 Tax=Nocardia arseniciresistens TaxID=3392119 RepID=UPI00398F780B